MENIKQHIIPAVGVAALLALIAALTGVVEGAPADAARNAQNASVVVSAQAVECVDGRGIIRLDLTNDGSEQATYTVAITGQLQGFSSQKTVTIDPNVTTTVGFSGRFDGVYDVEVAAGSRPIASIAGWSNRMPDGVVVHCGNDDVTLVSNTCRSDTGIVYVSARNPTTTTREYRMRLWYETQPVDNLVDTDFAGIERRVTLAPGEQHIEAVSGRAQDVAVLIEGRSGAPGFVWSEGDLAGDSTALIDCQGGPNEAAATASCLGGKGRIDVFLIRPDGLGTTAATYAVRVRNNAGFDTTRTVELPVGDETLTRGKVTVTGRPDGNYFLDVTRTVGAEASPIELAVPVVTVACDEPPTVASALRVTCLGGRGRIDVDVANTASEPASFVIGVDNGDLAPRTVSVPGLRRARVTFTGRPNGVIPVYVTRDGMQILSAPVVVNCRQSIFGAETANDPLFPELGNAGYDVTDYDLTFDFDATTGSIDAVATIDLVPSLALERFSFDLVGFSVSSVAVDDKPAEFTRPGNKLRITPDVTLTPKKPATVTVRYSGIPQGVPIDAGLGTQGWQKAGSVSFMAGEPAGAAGLLPVNDTPTDKARFAFTVTVDDGIEVVANGALLSSSTNAGRTTWRYADDDPQASYLTQLAIGDLSFDDDGSVPAGIAGPVQIRHAYADSVAAEVEPLTARTGEMVTKLSGFFGPYPFDEYGTLVVDSDLGFALETQTLSVFGTDAIDVASIQVHELAHQWFGNHVSVGRWNDIWLNEGFATYAERFWDTDGTIESIQPAMSDMYDRLVEAAAPPPGSPARNDLFNYSVYQRGAMVLYAYHVEVGDAAFYATLRTWAKRYGGSSATTEDFVALANEISGKSLDDFFEAWVYGETMPAFPTPTA